MYHSVMHRASCTGMLLPFFDSEGVLVYKLELKQQQGCEVTAASIFWMLLSNLGCCRLHVHAVRIQSQVRNLCDSILSHRVLVQSCLRTADPVNAI